MGNVAQFVKHVGQIDSKGENDTLRLWESYREQATLWRVIALAQMLGSFLMICFCFYLYNTRQLTISVPPQPLPGEYSPHEIPEQILIGEATELVNLIATYRPHTARQQFEAALEMIDEPALSIFKEKMLGLELKAIQSTARTQHFYVDPTKTIIEGTQGGIKVSLTGDRMKIIAGSPVPTVVTRYSFTMNTIPRNKINPYGLVTTNIEVENVPY